MCRVSSVRVCAGVQSARSEECVDCVECAECVVRRKVWRVCGAHRVCRVCVESVEDVESVQCGARYADSGECCGDLWSANSVELEECVARVV